MAFEFEALKLANDLDRVGSPKQQIEDNKVRRRRLQFDEKLGGVDERLRRHPDRGERFAGDFADRRLIEDESRSYECGILRLGHSDTRDTTLWPRSP
jgi:hypothetical protein